MGASTPEHLDGSVGSVLLIAAKGHGTRQMCRTDKYGFPRRHVPRQKRHFEFRTGDLVKAVVPGGKYAGTHVGRMTIRSRPSFRLNGIDVHPRTLMLIGRTDGYAYALQIPRPALAPPTEGGGTRRGQVASVRKEYPLMDGAIEKLELGLQRLDKAGDDADLLGLALQSIHGALEDHFRSRLSVDSHVPADQRAALADPKKAQWKDLLDAMQLYGDLSAPNRELIWRANALRTKVAHGGRYTGSRADLDRYAALVQTLCGYVPPIKPAVSPPSRPPAEKPAGGRSPAPQDIPRAVRARPPAAPERPRSPWPGGLLALALLLGLATFVVLRNVTPPRAESAAEATTPATDVAAATAVPATSVPPTLLPRAATVTAADGLNLRGDHNRLAALVATLPSGTRVAIVGEPVQDDGFTWWNVEADGRRGWCAGEFLAFD